jgi:hypothetical protein
VRIILHSLRALCKAPEGAGSICKYLEVLARATRVPGRFAYGFRTEIHFAEVMDNNMRIEIEKCVFNVTKITFVRFVVSGSGVRMDSDNTKLIVDWPQHK